MVKKHSYHYAFNHTALSHFDYHWFWGLRCHQHQPDNNLATASQALMTDDDLRAQLQQQQQAVTTRALMIQWLYRWFNLDNYAYHTYQLAAYESNQCFKEVARAADDTREEAIYCVSNHELTSPGWALEHIVALLDATDGVNAIAYESINAGDESSASGSTFIPFYQGTATPLLASVEQPVFTVTQAMIPYLAILMISATVGEPLAWSRIRQTFRQAVLVHHPDKSTGAADQFIAVKHAFDNLKTLVFPDNDQQTSQAQQWDNYFAPDISRMFAEMNAAHNRIDAILDRVEAGYREIRQTNAETRQLTAEIRQLTAERRQRTVETRQLTAEIKQRNDNITLTCEDLSRRLAKLLQAEAPQAEETSSITSLDDSPPITSLSSRGFMGTSRPATPSDETTPLMSSESSPTYSS